MESYANTLEGANFKVMFLYRSIIQFGQESLCKEEKLTTVCSMDGDWKPITDDNDTCVELIELSGIVITYQEIS